MKPKPLSSASLCHKTFPVFLEVLCSSFTDNHSPAEFPVSIICMTFFITLPHITSTSIFPRQLSNQRISKSGQILNVKKGSAITSVLFHLEIRPQDLAV